MNDDERPDLPDLFASIGVAVGAFVAILAICLSFGWVVEPSEDDGAPSGVLISVVWTVLIAGLACARWLLLRVNPDADTLAACIVCIGIAMLVYPFFSFGLENTVLGLAGNFFIAGALILTGLRAARLSGLATAFLFMPLLWLGYVSYLTLQTVI